MQSLSFWRNILLTTSQFLKVHREEVLQTIFAYLDLLRAHKSYESIFRELQQVRHNAWRWLEKGEPLATVRTRSAFLLDPYPPEQILSGSILATQFDPDLIAEYLSFLTLERCRVFMGTKQPLEGREDWSLKEPFYGTKYDLLPMDISNLTVSTWTKHVSCLSILKPELSPRQCQNSILPCPSLTLFSRPSLIWLWKARQLW